MAGEIIVGLDIGTTKMCAVVGELHPDGIEIIGIGSHPSDGLRKGVVVNIERIHQRSDRRSGNHGRL
jgi:cell division protein FtsA